MQKHVLLGMHYYRMISGLSLQPLDVNPVQAIRDEVESTLCCKADQPSHVELEFVPVEMLSWMGKEAQHTNVQIQHS